MDVSKTAPFHGDVGAPGPHEAGRAAWCLAGAPCPDPELSQPLTVAALKPFRTISGFPAARPAALGWALPQLIPQTKTIDRSLRLPPSEAKGSTVGAVHTREPSTNRAVAKEGRASPGRGNPGVRCSSAVGKLHATARNVLCPLRGGDSRGLQLQHGRGCPRGREKPASMQLGRGLCHGIPAPAPAGPFDTV